MQYDSYKDSGEQWLGQIPSHWEMRAIRYILQPQHKVVGKNANEYALLSLTLNGVIKRDMDNPTGKFPTTFDTYQEVNPDDFIFCMFDNEETPRAVGLSRYRGMITGAYDVMQNINALVNNRFLEYYFLDIDNFKKLKPLYKGLRKTVPLDSFKAMKIALPPLDEQERMVVYLDKETAAIDAAIAQQQKMIDLLNERKQIIIQQAVTKKGENWQSLALRYILKPRKNIVGRNSKFYELLSLTLKGIVIRDINNPEGKFPSSFDTYQEVVPGDFVFCMFDNEETPRAVGLSRHRGMITGAYDVMSLINENLSAEYLELLFLYIDDGKRLKPLYKGLRKTVPIDAFLSTKIDFPSIEEQSSICEKVQKQLLKIEQGVDLIEQQISLLRERKQIIINEVVTGKIKV